MATRTGEPGAEARTAARWWADKLRSGFMPDNGARPGEATRTPEALGLIALARARDEGHLTEAKIDAFEVALARRVQAMLDDGGDSPYITLSVDYGPAPELADALKEADIPVTMTVLPWKTCMWVDPGSVSVGDGYGAEPRELPMVAS